MLNPCCPNCGCMPCVCPPTVCACVAAISGTPPTNATPGMLWFDGAVLWIWTGAAWVVVGPSAGQYQIAAFASPGTFVFQVPADVTATTTFRFRLQGGGGGGGGAATTATWSAQGGGGGEFKEVAAIGLLPGLDVSCTVGVGGTGGSGGGNGQNGQPSSIQISSSNTTILANGGAGGWGDTQVTNAGQGVGGHDGVFTPGTANFLLVMSVPGGDAHLGVDVTDGAVGGAGSFLGAGAPSFNDKAGWVDVTGARGYGAGGRGGYNQGDIGGAGTAGLVIVERIKG